METQDYHPDAHDAMQYQMQPTCDSTMSLRPSLHNNNQAALDRLKDMPVPHNVGSKACADGTDAITAGTSTASCMEIDSPKIERDSADKSEERHGTSPYVSESGHWTSTNKAFASSASIAVGGNTSSSEGMCIGIYQQLVDSLSQQCSMLTIERNAAARALRKVRRDLVEQQVCQMEDKADLEDIIARLRACNSALEARLDSQRGPRRVRPLESSLLRCTSPSTS
jgi:hypothetical protein